jgi:hypothetical protein
VLNTVCTEIGHREHRENQMLHRRDAEDAEKFSRAIGSSFNGFRIANQLFDNGENHENDD